MTVIKFSNQQDAPPHGEPAVTVHAAARVVSGSPPQSDVKYGIDYATDGGQTWTPLVKDWTIPRRGEEPREFWSQSFCYGSGQVAAKDVSAVRDRLYSSNAAGRLVSNAIERASR